MFVDAPLAQRIFRSNQALARATTTAAQSLGFVSDGYLELGDAFALFMGEGSPLTQAYGRFGAATLDALRRFYAVRTGEWEAIVTPFDGPEAIQAVLDAGGRVKGWESTLIHRLRDLPTFPVADDVAVEIVEGDARAEWCETVLRGFMDDAEAPAALRAIVETASATEHLRTYLARYQGEPAAGGALFVHEGTAFLGCTSTRPAFRRRGLQTALIARRLRDAAPAADLAWIGTDPGSGSQRNVERAGFRLAYTHMSFLVPVAG